MPCPRCGALLVEHDTDGMWLRFWTCQECDAAYHLADGVLQRGRNRPVRFVEDRNGRLQVAAHD